MDPRRAALTTHGGCEKMWEELTKTRGAGWREVEGKNLSWTTGQTLFRRILILLEAGHPIRCSAMTCEVCFVRRVWRVKGGKERGKKETQADGEPEYA